MGLKSLLFRFDKIDEFIKVAHVVNLKLAFTESFSYNLVILIKLCKIWYLNLDKTLLFWRNQVTWQAPNTIKFNIFLLNFCTCFLFNNVYERVFGIFFFRSWVINKNVKNECVESSFFIFANNTRSKQNKKNPKHSFADIGKKKTCAKFKQKILKSMVVRARQNFQFFRQKTWFLENNRDLSKFLYGIFHYLVSSNHDKISQ